VPGPGAGPVRVDLDDAGGFPGGQGSQPLSGLIRSDEAGDVPVRPGRLNRAVSVEQRPDTLADGVLGLVGAVTGGGHDGSSYGGHQGQQPVIGIPHGGEVLPGA
jgi:hypothetical protein